MYLHTFLLFKNPINISLYRIFKLFMCMCKGAQMPAEARRAGTPLKLPLQVLRVLGGCWVMKSSPLQK